MVGKKEFFVDGGLWFLEILIVLEFSHLLTGF